MCTACGSQAATGKSNRVRMVTDEHHETAYWLAGLTSTTQLFLCGPCYCAVTNTADGSINRSIVLSPLERVQLSAVEYLE